MHEQQNARFPYEQGDGERISEVEKHLDKSDQMTSYIAGDKPTMFAITLILPFSLLVFVLLLAIVFYVFDHSNKKIRQM